MSEGAFEIVEGDSPGEYNIKPLNKPIPPDQHELHSEIYRTRGTLKILAEQGVFRGGGKSGEEQARVLEEFQERIRQIAEAGLVAKHAHAGKAADALRDLREELLVRVGKAVKFRYLIHLAGWAAAGVALGGILYAWAQYGRAVWPAGYGLLVMGAAAGAWLSVAATRWSVAFEDLPNFLDWKVEPLVRMLFVTVLALVVGVALHAGLFRIDLAGTSLADFKDSESIALLLGLVTGVSERALATRFIESARTLAEG